ncbi:site-specific integrase [Halorubrum ezzemoulense]|uniref:site-specific integrase n=1 Tax=Halorubrum ezzemoulense TaxID=337243 RepID=UPI00233000D3|nr:site-specific integrase [Halorubrum ezzemoulense]MDB2286941.1 site-specific integrase [Halorubrum ezzemoulense]
MKKRQMSDGYRLYLHPNEYEVLLDCADEIGVYAQPEEVELLMRFGGESGLRADSSINTTPNNIVESSDPDSDVSFIEVWGKDTTGKTEDGKYRKTILTKATAACISQLQQKKHLDEDEPFVSKGRSAVDNWASKLGTIAAEKTGKDDFEHFTLHDLRAYFATNCLVRHGMNMETVMTVGGWNDYDTMKRYLSVTADQQIIEDFETAGLLDGAGWEDYADIEADGQSVYSKVSAATPMGAAAQLSALGADQMATRVEDFAEETQEDSWTIGRLTPAESQTALRAGKYGAFVGVGAAGLAGSVPSLTPATVMPFATLAMAAPILRGWHRVDGDED